MIPVPTSGQASTAPAPSVEPRHLARLRTIITAAARVFATWGHSRTQIQDVAAEAGVAPGTIYLYAASKDALFDLALRFAMSGGWAFLAEITPPHRATPETTRAWLGPAADWRRLFTTLAPRLDAGPSDVTVAEVIGALWDDLDRLRLAVRITERSAREWKDLNDLFFARIREPLLRAIVAWIDAAERQGRIRLQAPAAVTARHVMGFVSWSAVRRHFDAGGVVIHDDDGCRAATVALLTSGLTGSPVP